MVGAANLKGEDLNFCFEKMMMAGSGNGVGVVKMEGLAITDWKDIPMELLLRIVSLVDDRTAIVASGVCSGWRDAICMGLTHLCLSWCRKNMNDLVLSLIPKFTKLETLILRQEYPQLEDDAAEAIAKFCHDLQDLDLSKSFKLTDRSLYALAHGFPDLVKLNISGCTSFSDEALAYLTSFCSKLKILNLCGCVKGATDRALQAIGRNCNMLQSLNLDWCEYVGDSGVMCLAYGCPDLRTLDLCGCVLITDDSVIALANRCPHLRSLGLYYCRNITDRAMYSLAHNGVKNKSTIWQFSSDPVMGLLREIVESLRELNILPRVMQDISNEMTRMNHVLEDVQQSLRELQDVILPLVTEAERQPPQESGGAERQPPTARRKEEERHVAGPRGKRAAEEVEGESSADIHPRRRRQPAKQNAKEELMKFFKRYKEVGPTEFDGLRDTYRAMDWLEETEDNLSLSHIPPHHRVEIATFYLKGQAKKWWKSYSALRDGENQLPPPERHVAIEWHEFKERFQQKYVTESAKDSKRKAFENLMQHSMTVLEYEQQFSALIYYAPYMDRHESVKVKKFAERLRPSLRRHILPVGNQTYHQVVEKAMTLEAEFQESRAREAEGPSRARLEVTPGKTQMKRSWEQRLQVPSKRRKGFDRWCPICRRFHASSVCNQGSNVCNYCKQPGHWARTCPMRPPQQGRGQPLPVERKIYPREASRPRIWDMASLLQRPPDSRCNPEFLLCPAQHRANRLQLEISTVRSRQLSSETRRSALQRSSEDI